MLGIEFEPEIEVVELAIGMLDAESIIFYGIGAVRRAVDNIESRDLPRWWVGCLLCESLP